LYPARSLSLLIVQLSRALPVLGGGAGDVGGGEDDVGEEGGGGEDVGEGGGVVTDKVGVSNCERLGICPTRRCRPRPPATLLPDETAAPFAALARALAAPGLAVVTPASGTEVPDKALVVRGACRESADTPVDRRLSLDVGIVDGGCEGREVLCVRPPDGEVTTPCPGRLVNLRWSERAVDGDGEGDAGSTALGSTGLESDSWR
jgi:hypothetical protein